MSPLPLFELTPAESILAPFEDERIAPQLPLTVEGAALGFRRSFRWDNTTLEWDRAEPGQLVGALTLALAPLPERFDEFVFCLVLPTGVRAQFAAQRDGRWEALGDAVIGVAARMEVVRPIGAAPVAALRLELFAADAGPGQAQLRWWGVAEAQLVRHLEAARPSYGSEWTGLIKSVTEWGEPEFARGLLFAVTDLPTLRAKAQVPVWAGHLAMMEERARAALTAEPERDIGDFLPWSDYRYLRAREQGKSAWFAEPVLCALVGLVRNDRVLIRHALRYLLCFAHTRQWCQSAESRVRGSTWDQRCFIEEMATTTCVLLYDWLYFALTDRARDLVRTAIWDKGLSVIQRDMVKWEYVHTMNQGPWFCRARLLGALAFEPVWPRARSYAEQAFADLQEGMGHYLLPDGGVDEGVGYFSVTLQAVLPALLAYARARGRPVGEVLPPRLSLSGNFVAIMSAMSPGGVLMDGDNSNDRFTGDSIALLAALFPHEVYRRIAKATLLQLRGATYYRQYMIDGPFAFIAGPADLPEPECIVPNFGVLPHTGQLTSRREVAPGRSVRLHLTGAKARASHTHFDKGGLTLELDEEPVFIDRGVVRYDDPRHLTMKRSELHNLATPLWPDGQPAQQPLPEIAIIPEGEGDERRLRARIELTPVWRHVALNAAREITAESAGEFVVRDDFTFATPLAVAFHLQTRQPWKIAPSGREAVLELARWRVTLRAPWAMEMCQREDGLDHRYAPVWHLEARAAAATVHELHTEVSCEPR